MTFIYVPVVQNYGGCYGEEITRKINDSVSITTCNDDPQTGALLILIMGSLIFLCSFMFREGWGFRDNKAFWLAQGISYPIVIFGIIGMIILK